MKIVTWNVNSIKARLNVVEEFIKEQKPDIIMFQELKAIEELFPLEALHQYNAAVFGQKTYNGVAILSKYPIEEVQKGIPNYHDKSARYIEVFTNGIRVICVYAPNGQNIESEQYPHKLSFYKHLYVHLKNIFNSNEKIVMGGDFNVPLTENDIYDAERFKNDVPFTIQERRALNAIINIGFVDAHRLTTPEKSSAGPFTWWDYRRAGFDKNFGMRIDYIFLSPNLLDLHKKTHVDIMTRQKEKTSDHAPLICEIDL